MDRMQQRLDDLFVLILQWQGQRADPDSSVDRERHSTLLQK
jgi:hypothetical protein